MVGGVARSAGGAALRRCAAAAASSSSRLSTSAAAATATGVSSRGYHRNVVDHYNNPRNVGSFNKDDPSVGTGLVGAPACGDVMKLQIRVAPDGTILDSCFKTFGCGSAIASSSVATEWIKGRSIEDATSIRNSEIAKHLSLPPVKLHCSMLAEDAIKAAVKDVRQKMAMAKSQVGDSTGSKDEKPTEKKTDKSNERQQKQESGADENKKDKLAAKAVEKMEDTTSASQASA
eukprot:jgi/Chlat1/951/Chrsp108S01381